MTSKPLLEYIEYVDHNLLNRVEPRLSIETMSPRQVNSWRLQTSLTSCKNEYGCSVSFFSSFFVWTRRSAAVSSPLPVEEEPVRVSGSVGRLAGYKCVRRRSVAEGQREYFCVTCAFGLGLLDDFFVLVQLHNRRLRKDQYKYVQRKVPHTRRDIDLVECKLASDWSSIISGSLSSEGTMKSSSSLVFLRFPGRGLSKRMY
jgi:hypothetical protein